MFLALNRIIQTGFTIADVITCKKKSALPDNKSPNKDTRICEFVYVIVMVKKCANMPIVIQDVNISNWDWTTDFDNQIKETMVKTQKEKTAKADVEIEMAINEKKVVAAQAQLQADPATYRNALNKAENELEIARKNSEA